MPNDKAGLGLLIIGGLVLWGISRVEPEKKLERKYKEIPILINESVAAMNEARQAATTRDWSIAVAKAQQSVEIAKQAEATAGQPIPNQKYPTISLSELAQSHLEGAKMQEYAATQTSPTGYATGGFENAGDFGYGAGVF